MFLVVFIRPRRMHRVRGCCGLLLLGSVSVSVLSTSASPTKTVEPIETPFGLWTRVGPRNHYIIIIIIIIIIILAHQHKACRQLKIKQEMTAVGD